MGAAKDASACAQVMSNQILSVGAIALNVASMGAASKVEEAATAAEKAAQATAVAKKAEEAATLTQRLKATAVKIVEVKSCIAALWKIAGDAKDNNDATTIEIDSIAGAATCIQDLTGFGALKAEKVITKGELKGAEMFMAALQLRIATAQASNDIANNPNASAADQVQAAANVVSALDPTGIANAVAAYSYPKCSAIFK